MSLKALVNRVVCLPLYCKKLCGFANVQGNNYCYLEWGQDHEKIGPKSTSGYFGKAIHIKKGISIAGGAFLYALK
jgi:hypothetical protein